MPRPESISPLSTPDRLLRCVAQLRDELRSGGDPSRLPPVRLDSRLDRELGFDSLARAELLLRIESEFSVRLPAELLSLAETPQDLLAALGHSVAVPPAPTFEDIPAQEGRPAPETLTTLAAVLQWHAAHQPDRTHLVYLDEGERPEPMSYGRLWNAARAVAAALQARGIAPGQAVALMLPTCPAFFPCFFGILLAGAVPVPIYPPARPREIEDHLRRHAAILANADARLMIANERVALPARLLIGQVENLAGVALADELFAANGAPVASPVAVPVHAGDLALLQYTSGSTGVPKGVTLTHAQLLANIHAMARAAKVGRDDVFVSWLPLYHDMGLICAWLSSLVYALPFVVMSPLAFLARPARWLQAIGRYRGTLSGAPNFAYELCLKRISDAELADLDLSSWRIAFNGAEPVSADTMTRFAARFSACGLKPEALAPVYGLAECAVGLALTPGRGARIDRIRRADFALRGEAVPAEGDADAMNFVLCGRPLPGYAIRVVDETGAELPERREGRIQFRGPSATAGYYRNAEATARLIRDGWWETGDRGYLVAGEIVPSGRVKDIIIKGGRNLYPQEIEQAVGAVAGIRKGCVAAFGSPDPASGTERLVVMAELVPSADASAVRAAAQAAVMAVAGLPADDLVLSTRRIVLKTSSGKVRRAASRELYERGMKDVAAAHYLREAVWLQVARLALSGVLPQARRGLRALGERLAGVWAAGLFCLFAGPVWLMAAVSPAPTFAWKSCGAAARLWLRLAGIRLKIDGLENLPNTPCVLVANHASYLDGLALVAALPWRNWRFVAKRELRDKVFPRVFLERLGCDFVERFDFRQGVADAERLRASVAAGHAPIFFPEGTFTRVPGLAPFRMGAFLVAAGNGVPVIPVALAGARDRLREGHWLPRRGALTVSCRPPILPDGEDWHAALRLRDAARAEILRHCGEPDLQG